MLGFAALSDPSRVRIVEMLAAQNLSAGQIHDHFEVSAPAISQHLKILKDAGLVTVRVDAQRRIYSLDRAGISEIRQWAEGVERFWNQRLDALESALNQEDHEGGSK